MKIKIALAQIDLIKGQPRKNLEKAKAVISRAGEEDHDMILFPELWSTGYDLENWRQHAEYHQENLLTEISGLASLHRIMVGGSLLEEEKAAGSNRFTLFAKDGKVVGRYDKLHLFRLMDEEKWLVPGNQLALVTTLYGKFGLAICYDLRFPEMFRNYALAGAQVVLIVAEWPAPRIEHWKTLLRARAIENQFFIVGVNRVGTENGNDFPGASMVVDPGGEILLEMGNVEDLGSVTLDLDLVERTRKMISVFQDRRPDVYSAGVLNGETQPSRGDVY